MAKQKSFKEIFFSFEVEGEIVLFPRDRFDYDLIKSGEQQFDILETKNGRFLAIERTEILNLNFKPRWKRRTT